MNTEDKLKHIKKILEDMKAEDVLVVDASSRTILADAFVVATATSDTHARAMGERVHVELKAAGIRVDHAEMDAGRDWTIMDFGDIVLHIFLEKARRYYNLEELWGQVQKRRKDQAEPVDKGRPRGDDDEDENDEGRDNKPTVRPVGKKKPLSPGMERLAEETRAARGAKTKAPTYRTGAKPVRKGTKPTKRPPA